MTDVSHKVDGSTLLARINRPDRANALRRRTIHELEALLVAAEASEPDSAGLPGARITGVVITGGSKRFSAGADLATLTGTVEDLEFDDALEQLCHRIIHSPLPVVAAVEGACFGAAVDLAWACDAVVISEEARVALPSTSLGILYNPLSVARLHSRLGSSTLRRLMVLQQELEGRELPHWLGRGDATGRCGFDRRAPRASGVRGRRRHGGHQGSPCVFGQWSPVRPRTVAGGARSPGGLTRPPGGPRGPPGLDHEKETAASLNDPIPPGRLGPS